MSMFLGATIAVSCASSSLAAENPARDVISSENQSKSDPAAVIMSEDLSQRSDTELTALTAQWADLSPAQRRTLLAEVRGRMAKTQSRPRLVGVRVQRKYGRVVRKPDGSVVLQTRVVQVSPRVRSTVNPQRGRVTFGFGFERRTKSKSVPAPDALIAESGKTQALTSELPDNPETSQPPAMTVSQQQATPVER